MPLPSGSNFIRLYPDYKFKEFDCGDSDLNAFIINDSKAFLQKLLAVTYVIEYKGEMVAFLNLLNDKVSLMDGISGNQWKKIFVKNVGKNIRSYPSVKIGRLGVSNSYQKAGIGRALLDYTKELFITNNRTGCRYITVDAYKASLQFYEKNGFKFLTDNDKNANTRLMYFDLMPLDPHCSDGVAKHL